MTVHFNIGLYIFDTTFIATVVSALKGFAWDVPRNPLGPSFDYSVRLGLMLR